MDLYVLKKKERRKRHRSIKQTEEKEKERGVAWANIQERKVHTRKTSFDLIPSSFIVVHCLISKLY